MDTISLQNLDSNKTLKQASAVFPGDPKITKH